MLDAGYRDRPVQVPFDCITLHSDLLRGRNPALTVKDVSRDSDLPSGVQRGKSQSSSGEEGFSHLYL